MTGFRARVQNGRLVIDEPTDLGTVLDLVVGDEGDNLTDQGRAALHAAIERSVEGCQGGEGAAGRRCREGPSRAAMTLPVQELAARCGGTP